MVNSNNWYIKNDILYRLLFALQEKYNFNDDFKYKIQFFVNMHINPLRYNAFNEIKNEICKKIKITKKRI